MNALIIDVAVLREAVRLLDAEGAVPLAGVAEMGACALDRRFRIVGLRQGPNGCPRSECGGGGIGLVHLRRYQWAVGQRGERAGFPRDLGAVAWWGILGLALDADDWLGPAGTAFKGVVRRLDCGETCRIDALVIREELSTSAGPCVETLTLWPDGNCEVLVEAH